MNTRELLARLVAFPTVSRDSNLACIDFIAGYLRQHGIESHLVPNAEGTKANLFARIGPDVPGGVVLSGHTDVVPIDGQAWSSDPWTLREADGYLYGRGTCDMKGFLASALAAVPAMTAANLRAPVFLAFSFDEEAGCAGAPLMIDEMARTIPRPSAVLVGEATGMQVITGHKGTLSFFTHVTGHTVHSSRVDIGVSAVMVAARLVTWLTDTMDENRRRADPASPFLPPYTTLHCGMINGGTAVNLTAAECRFVTEIRNIPSEDGRAFKARYLDYIRNEIEPAMKAISPAAGVDVIHRAEVPSLAPEHMGAAETLARGLTGDNGTHVAAYGTEGGLFQRAGWSTVVCGPGDVAYAHQPDERIALAELASSDAFLHRLVSHVAL